RHATEELGQVVQESTTEAGDLVGGEAAQVAFQGFGPQPERRCRPEGIGPGGEDHGATTVAGGQLFDQPRLPDPGVTFDEDAAERSEEHTSELQSQSKLVCRLLLEKKNT